MAKKPTMSPEEMAEALRDLGFSVERQGAYTKHTFEVQEELLERFMTTVKRKRMKVKHAMSEALNLWLDRNKSG